MNEILNEIDIENIEKDARTNPEFQYYGVRILGVSNLKYDEIITISDKRLIMIKGNSLTGYVHIKERHLFWSTKSYSNGKEFQAQSKFPQNIAPVDFIKIADSIYLEENLVIKNTHNDADKFEKYVGLHTFNGEEVEQINLILYKGTKIIHSLYPQNKKHNKSRNRTKYPYTRGIVKVKSNNNYQIIEIYVPFLNINMYQEYGLLIEKNYEKQTETWNVLVFDEQDGKYKFHIEFCEREIILFRGDTSARITFQFCDLRPVEDFLLRIDERDKKK